ncbi:MAG: nucleoside deaminase [bacterium]
MLTPEFHEKYMRQALHEAERAAEAGEVPAGCVIVRLRPDAATREGHASACLGAEACAAPTDAESQGLPLATGTRIIARAHNQTEMLKDPTAHAEILAITQAAAALGDWRLTNTILYVTKEPCSMCAGAIVLARIPLVVWGLSDPKRGGHSVFSILNHEGLNHRPDILKGVMETECREMFQAFFKAKRGLKE